VEGRCESQPVVTITKSLAAFRFLRPGAQRVFLAGDFNGWRPEEIRMRPVGRGAWEARLRLAPGTYRFRYCCDGCWYPDYAAFGVVTGPYGYDGVLRVA